MIGDDVVRELRATRASEGGQHCESCSKYIVRIFRFGMIIAMRTIAELTSEDKLKELAIESNRQLGREILAYDKIDLTENTPGHVHAQVRVPTGQTRTVDITVDGESLVWKCTCGSASGKNDVFCKHCIAVALKLAEPRGGAEGVE